MSNKSILLVEDNSDDVELTLRAFRRNNILNDIHVVRDGAEALAHLLGPDAGIPAEGPAPLPALVLLDLKMPKIDGFEALRRIRAHKRTQFVPVVILTSSGQEDDLVTGYRLGANSYIRKPVDFAAFVKTALHLGLYWLVLNEVPPAPKPT